MKISGQCHCGAVSFTADVDPSKVLVCHCSDCQQFSGAPFRAVLPTPVDQVTLQGQAKHCVKVADSGTRRVQAFCPECGTQLYATEPEQPQVMNLRVGCIRERAQLAPARQIWGTSAMPWVGQMQATPLHEKGLASPLMPPVC